MSSTDTIHDWLTTFWRILVAPNSGTFLAESQKAENKFTSALFWLAFFSLYYFSLAVQFGGFSSKVHTLLFLILVVPAVVVIFGFVLQFTCCRIFHTSNDLFNRILYLTVAILVPLQLLALPLNIFLPRDMGNYLYGGILLYQFGLIVWSFKALTHLKAWQSLISVGISAAVCAGLILCALIETTINGAAPGF